MENEVIKFKVSKCLKCKSETHSDDEKELFCSQCGAPVVNVCSNYECQEYLEPTAKFCKYCGSPSIFKNYGLLNSSSTPPDDLPF